MSDNAQSWYIVKQEDGSCEILELSEQTPTEENWWGPFPSQSEAIARRVGLIRSQKCKPR